VVGTRLNPALHWCLLRHRKAGKKFDQSTGTDVALILAWLRVIIGDDLYDRDFVAKWTVGFDDLKAAVASTRLSGRQRSPGSPRSRWSNRHDFMPRQNPR
jgi:predicted molibdopterin-dependent oxidoreductase YjgC